MPHPIHTYIRKEAAALLGLAAVSIVALLVLGIALLGGDNRRVEVRQITPAEGAEVPSTIRAMSVEFSPNVDRDAVLKLLTIEPAFSFAARWRGSTLELLPDEPLASGAYALSLAAGSAGRGGERLREPVVRRFEVRLPSVLLIVPGQGESELVRVKAGGETSALLQAALIVDFAPSPDGTLVAVVTGDAGGRSSLVLVDTVDGSARPIVEPGLDRVVWVRWAPDGQSLLVVRSESLPDGSLGVGRAWVMRISGDYVGQVDQQGEPTLAPRWSPNGDRIAYVAPASAQLVALHATTQERVEFGAPRATEFDWSPSGDRIAFESVPAGGESGPLTQPVRIRSLDLSTDLFIGEPGEIVSQPRWTALDTLAVLWRQTGPQAAGTQIWFLSIPLGEKLRAIQLTAGAERVSSWDLSGDGEHIVFASEAQAGSNIHILELATNGVTTLEVSGRLPRWLP